MLQLILVACPRGDEMLIFQTYTAISLVEPEVHPVVFALKIDPALVLIKKEY